MRLFRCRNCNREFRADVPACEACGLDAAKDPRDAELVVPLALIHLDPPTHVEGRGRGHAACDPKLKAAAKDPRALAPGEPVVMFTSEPTAANCPACKVTPEYAAALAGETPVRPSAALRVGPPGGPTAA